MTFSPCPNIPYRTTTCAHLIVHGDHCDTCGRFIEISAADVLGLTVPYARHVIPYPTDRIREIVAEDRAVARAGDPETSWAAADALDPDKLRESQRDILELLMARGPMTDEELVRHVRMSPSGARTRRSELVDKGLVYDTGKRDLLVSGRHAIVWAANRLTPLSEDSF